jgi:hypothetical protein
LKIELEVADSLPRKGDLGCTPHSGSHVRLAVALVAEAETKCNAFIGDSFI